MKHSFKQACCMQLLLEHPWLLLGVMGDDLILFREVQQYAHGWDQIYSSVSPWLRLSASSQGPTDHLPAPSCTDKACLALPPRSIWSLG